MAPDRNDFPVQQVAGENRFIHAPTMDGSSVGSAGQIWTNTCSDPDDPFQSEVTACLQ